jgi:hypothetical protein
MTTVFLFVFGFGLLGVAYQAHRSGEIPAGSKGLKPFRPSRTQNPFAFYFFLTLYIAAGSALLMWGILVVAGVAQPLALT